MIYDGRNRFSGAAFLRFGRDVQDDGTEAAAGHPGIRHPEVIVNAPLMQCGRYRQIVTKLRHTGRALRPISSENDHRVFVHIGGFVRQPLFRHCQVVKNLGRPPGDAAAALWRRFA